MDFNFLLDRLNKKDTKSLSIQRRGLISNKSAAE